MFMEVGAPHHQLGFQGRGQFLLAGLAVQIVKLERIVHQIEQLPLLLLPEIDQFLCAGTDPVVCAGIVIAGVVVVAGSVGISNAPMLRR